MRTVLTLLMVLNAIGCFAQALILPTRRILPEDVQQDSIRTVRFATTSFAVWFTYTGAGATRMLAFRREHAGRNVMVQVGDFECPTKIMPLEFIPAGWTEEGYLKQRGDKFVGVSEKDAKKIVAGLTKK